jgi:hypothetical protein
MFMFGDIHDPFGHFGNMPEIPQDGDEQMSHEDRCLLGCICGVAVIVTLFLFVSFCLAMHFLFH